MKNWKRIETPLDGDIIEELRAGDRILLSGIMYTARDRAHERLCRMAELNEPLPFDPANQVIYYTGPSPAPAGKVIGSAGPTSSYRMDPFTECIMKLGVRGLVGKGRRDRITRDLLVYYGAVYFASFGGAGAYLSKRITESSLIAFDDLGPEAIYRLRVADFPLIVVNDVDGGDLYENSFHRGQ